MLSVPPAFAPLLAAPVAVFGGGVSGGGVCALLDALGATWKVYDEKGERFSAESARNHRLGIYSPGFAPEHAWFGVARAAGLRLLGELDFASLFWRGPVVAITGTNGKTTLTEFLTHALRRLHCDVYATGNIGYSFSRLALDHDAGTNASIAVCEVSSFQAETLQCLRPWFTLWTNFAEDHLERHPDLPAYFAAKWTLVERTPTGIDLGQAFRAAASERGEVFRPRADAANGRPGAFIGSSVAQYARAIGKPLAGVAAVATEGQPEDPALSETVFADYPQRENFLLARAWWQACGFADSALYEAARSFTLGRHRLARVGEAKGVAYWNDSKATNFHAVEAALQRFTTPVVLILGGKAKGGDLGGFVRRLQGRVAHVLLIGATARELAAHCAAAGIPHTLSGTLAVAVEQASKLAPRGGHVLLSPGFASFDQFRSYEDRGEQFEKLCRELIVESRSSTAASL